MAATGQLVIAREPSRQYRRLRAFARNRTAVIGLVLVAVLLAIALAAPALAPHDPLVQDPVHRLSGPSSAFPLGTDDFGRDILSRVLYGARIAFLIGVLSVLLAGVLGTLIGVVAGFRRGQTETWLMRLVDILLAFPDLITGLLIMAVLGQGLIKLIIAIALTITPRFARIAHGQALAVGERDFVLAARALGASELRVLLRHVLPNTLGELLVLGSLWTAAAIRLEASLSFIGLGVSPPTPSWGQMIRDGVVYLSDAPFFSIAPGLALSLTILAFNLVGDGLRDALDPRAQA